MIIDLHIHSKEISICGRMSVEELVDTYAASKYDAIVITNHFNTETAQYLEGKGCKDFIKTYFDCIRYAEELGRKKGLIVLGGHELRLNCSANDYLLYGMTEEDCKNWQELFAMTPKELSLFAREHDILLYQAHPFRNNMKVIDPSYLFGIESQNRHPRHDSRNDIAEMWAKKYSLHTIGGSDVHLAQDVCTGGIKTDIEVATVNDLVRVLRNDLYEIL